MFGWFKKDKPKESAKPTRGFFTTDMVPISAMDRAINRQAAFQRVFQKTPDDLVVVQGNTSMALDSSDAPTIKQGFARGFPETIPDSQIYWYAAQSFIGFQMMAMISQQWLVNKICAVPARDAVRTGFDISVDESEEVDPKALMALKKMDKDLKLTKNLVEFEYMKRVFGIRIMLFLVDGVDYELPFNPDGVKPGSYKGMSQIDPLWITPELDMTSVGDPASPDFYEPTWWRVNGQKIHKSHLVIARGPQVPDALKPTYQFAGISVPQQVFERVYAAERVANEAPELAMTKRMTILQVDADKAFANQKVFEEKMEWWTLFRDNYGVKVVGENETVTQIDTALNDFDMLIMTQYQLVCSIGNCPSTKILGTSPKGFNATGEYEESNYHEELESIQEHDLTPVIDRHHQLCILSEIAPKYNNGKVFETTVAWKPTDSMTAKEQAELNKQKADTDAVLADRGAIDGRDIRARLIKDPDSGYANLSLDDLPEENVEEETVEGEDPNADPEENPENNGSEEATDAMEGFDPATGRFDGAILITNQTYLDPMTVDEKRKAMDYNVQVSPEFTIRNKTYRIIIDGHHSLAAAIQDEQQPLIVEGEYRGSDYRNAITKGRAFDVKELMG